MLITYTTAKHQKTNEPESINVPPDIHKLPGNRDRHNTPTGLDNSVPRRGDKASGVQWRAQAGALGLLDHQANASLKVSINI